MAGEVFSARALSIAKAPVQVLPENAPKPDKKVKQAPEKKPKEVAKAEAKEKPAAATPPQPGGCSAISRRRFGACPSRAVIACQPIPSTRNTTVRRDAGTGNPATFNSTSPSA